MFNFSRGLFVQVILFGLSALLFTNAIVASFTMRFSFWLALLYLVALFFLLCGVFYPQLSVYCKEGIGYYTKKLVQIGFIAFVILAFTITWLGKNGSITYNEKAIIVLGSGLNGSDVSTVLQYRLDTAYAYHLENPTAYIVVTGGQGPTEEIPEAVAMKRYLVELGVPEELILVEDISTDTNENFTFALLLLEEKGIDGSDPVVFVSNRFHNYRAGFYAELAGFTNCSPLASATPLSMVLPCYMREVVAILHFWLFKRYVV